MGLNLDVKIIVRFTSERPHPRAWCEDLQQSQAGPQSSHELHTSVTWKNDDDRETVA